MGVVAPGKTFKCSRCGRSFANEIDLKYHNCSGKGMIDEATGIG